MNYYKLLILSIVYTLMGFAPVKADTTLPQKVDAFIPQVLLNRIIYEQDTKDLIKSGDWGQSEIPSMKIHWVVLSDRENNITYESPDNSVPFDALQFNERVIIAKIENDFALVYTDPKYPTWPDRSDKAISRGWVPMDNLLLWHSCPTTSTGIPRRAIIACNTEAGSSKNFGYVYKNPTETTDGTKIRVGSNFYYIMKTDQKSGLSLLATDNRTDGIISNVFFGWVDPNSFVCLDSRVFLEPNWDPNDVAYFNNPDGKQYPIYRDRDMKGEPTAFYRYGVVNPDDNKRSTKFRMNAYQLRYPLLFQEPVLENPDAYKCTIYGHTSVENINVPDEFRKMSEATEKCIDVLSKMKHINIIFVIDGTQSMKPYFASVKEAINCGINNIDTNVFTFKVGAVIYRDYADGEYLTEKVPLCRYNNPQLQSFLDSAGKYGAKSSHNNRTNTGALYKGLEVATDPAGMGFTKDESTIVVVVGDCGNDPNDTECLTSDQIADRVANNNIQLLSFQVDSRPSMAWKLFNEQMCEIVNQSLTKQYRRFKPDVKPKFRTLNNGYDFSSNTGEDFLIGSIRFPENEGEKMNASILTSHIVDNIDKFTDTVQERIQLFTDLIGKIDVNFNDNENPQYITISEQFVIDRIGKDRIKYMQGVPFTHIGYVPRKDAEGHEYWKEVALFSHDELDLYLNRLSKAYNAPVESGRNSFIDSVKDIMRILVPDITDKELDKVKYADVMRLAAGLEYCEDKEHSFTLKDLKNRKKVNEEVYQTIIHSFHSKYENLLNNVKNKNYRYSYETLNGQKFYWIPVEDLP